MCGLKKNCSINFTVSCSLGSGGGSSSSLIGITGVFSYVLGSQGEESSVISVIFGFDGDFGGCVFCNDGINGFLLGV